MPAETPPTHVAGFTIQTPIDFGVFGRCYVGFHSQEGRRILKILRDGEELALSDEEHAKLKEDPTLLPFEPRQQTEQGHRILIAHFFQAASMGILAQGSELQKNCDKTLRDLDPNSECAGMLRGTTLQQKLELVKTLAQRVEKLHAEKKTFPFLTPWNVMLSDAQPKLVDVGLGYAPEKLDLDGVHEDVLAYFAPEVVKCLADKKPVQVSPSADVYALALTARSILLERVIDVEGSGAPAPAQAAAGPGPGAPAAPAPAPSGGKRQALLAGKTWKRTPQEKISARLEGVLTRAASPDPRRRPTAEGFRKEIESILKDKAIVWTPPSQAPKLVAIGLLVLAIVAGVALALIPSPVEKQAQGAYAKLTGIADPKAQYDAFNQQQASIFKNMTPELAKKHPEILKVEGVSLLALAAKGTEDQRRLAVSTLRSYGKDWVPSTAGDGMTARFISAFIQRWALLELKESTDELKGLASGSIPADPGAKMIPTLAAIALRVGPFGVEGGDLKPEEAKAWLEATRDARADDAALGRAWPVPEGYEKFPDTKGLSYHSKWIATLLGGRLKAISGDESAGADLKEGSDAFPCFASTAAVALYAARAAKTADDIAKAQAALAEAAKLKKDNQTFGEGTLALADLAAKSARLAADGGKNDAGRWRDVVKAYETARADKAMTPGLDVTALAEKGRLLARRELGIAIARDAGSAGNANALKEAEAALSEVLAAFEKDKDFQNTLAPATHQALGLVLMVQPPRLGEAYPELAFFYNDGDPKNGYRKADDPSNKDVTTAFFNQVKTQFEALLASDKPDQAKHDALHVQLDALCKLEKFDLSFLALNDAKLDRKDADGFKGKKRVDALLRARNSFENVFNTSETAWAEGLAGYVEAATTVIHETGDDTQAAGKALTELQAFLDKAEGTLKGKKVPAKEIAKALDPARAQVRKEWFTVLGKWLGARADSTDLSNPDDMAFVTTILNVAEGQGAPELDAPTKSLVAQVHWTLGKFEYDQKKWTEAVKDLGQAVDGFADDKIALRSQAALLAADIALTRPGDVRAGETPWGGGASAAITWGRDLLAKRLGYSSYRTLADAVKQGKNKLITDEEAAKRLVDDILKNESSVTVDDITLATGIYTKSARAYLLLARGKAKPAPGENLDAKDAAKKAMDLADAQKEPEIAVEAAHIYFMSAPPVDYKSPDFRSVIDKAIGLSQAAAAKWASDAGKLPFAFAPLYWKGRNMQAVADDRASVSLDDTAKKLYLDAQHAFEDYKKACQAAQCAFAVNEAADVDDRIGNCARLAQ